MPKKPREPDRIEPVVVGSMRYEAPWLGAPVGVPQDGGVVAAYDQATGALSWAVSVYPRRPTEDEDGHVYITSMTPDADGTALLIANQMGEEYRLDLATRAVTALKVGHQ